MTALTLHLTADNPADIAALAEQALGHDRADHESFRIDPNSGEVTIRVHVAAEPADPTELLCDRAVTTQVDDDDEPIDWAGCQLLKDHDGVHFHPDVGMYDDDGNAVTLEDAADDEPTPATPTTRLSRGGASPPLTCGDAIIQLLASDRAIAWSIADIADGITGSYKQSTVSFTLGELARVGAIQRAGRGLYQANQV